MKKVLSTGIMLAVVGALAGYLWWDAPLIWKIIMLAVPCVISTVLVLSACMLSSDITQANERRTGRMEQEDFVRDERQFSQQGWVRK